MEQKSRKSGLGVPREANKNMNESLPVERSLVRRPRERKGRGTLMQGNISLLVAFKKIDYEVAPMR